MGRPNLRCDHLLGMVLSNYANIAIKDVAALINERMFAGLITHAGSCPMPGRMVVTLANNNWRIGP